VFCVCVLASMHSEHASNDPSRAIEARRACVVAAAFLFVGDDRYSVPDVSAHV